jgi:hypothetical protein
VKTLKTQYKEFLKDNPDSKITYKEWEKQTFNHILKIINSMDDDSDLSDWDTTINDGLEND